MLQTSRQQRQQLQRPLAPTMIFEKSKKSMQRWRLGRHLLLHLLPAVRSRPAPTPSQCNAASSQRRQPDTSQS
eukprot:6210455-Pleurochrysis_carterae.AAC.1